MTVALSRPLVAESRAPHPDKIETVFPPNGERRLSSADPSDRGAEGQCERSGGAGPEGLADHQRDATEGQEGGLCARHHLPLPAAEAAGGAGSQLRGHHAGGSVAGRRAAFQHGSLDAWVAYGVQAEAVRGTVGARVLTTGLGRLSGNYLFVAGAPAMNDPVRRAAIADYLGRVQRTWRWTDAHPDQWASLASAATGVPAALYAQVRAERSAPTTLAPVDAAAIASQQAVADGFAKAGVIPGHVDVSPLWDTGLNPEVTKLAAA